MSIVKKIYCLMRWLYVDSEYRWVQMDYSDDLKELQKEARLDDRIIEVVSIKKVESSPKFVNHPLDDEFEE